MWFQEAKRIYIVPVGKVQWWILNAIKEEIPPVFHKETVIDDEIALPHDCMNRELHQLHSTRLIESITKRSYNGMALGITDFDMYVEGLNYVFGEAEPAEGVAVISIARLKEEFYGGEIDQDVLLERTLKEVIHEIGHLFSLKHCSDPHCVMHFSNSIKDTDQKLRAFCTICESTLNDLS
jgi:archaemetzincin